MEADWFDMLPKQGAYKFPYRIQWDIMNGRVRAKHDNSPCWIVKECSVNAVYALHIGYELLEQEVKK